MGWGQPIVDCDIPQLVVLKCIKQAEQAKSWQPIAPLHGLCISSCLPVHTWSSCPDLPQWWTAIYNKPYPPLHGLQSEYFITTTENKIELGFWLWLLSQPWYTGTSSRSELNIKMARAAAPSLRSRFPEHLRSLACGINYWRPQREASLLILNTLIKGWL